MSKETWGVLIGAIAGAIGTALVLFQPVIAAAVLQRDVGIEVRDNDTTALIPKASYTVINPDGTIKLKNQRITQPQKDGNKILDVVKKDESTVIAFADNYMMTKDMFHPDSVIWQILLKKNLWEPTALRPVSLAGEAWEKWSSELSAISHDNTVTLNGKVRTAGYQTDKDRKIPFLSGRRLILEVTGVNNSTFYNNQLLKLEADDKVLTPENAPMLIENEYIPVFDGRFIFAIPDSFEGKINLVFYKATLNNLQIAAFYE